jgi:hypothetical protein
MVAEIGGSVLTDFATDRSFHIKWYFVTQCTETPMNLILYVTVLQCLLYHTQSVFTNINAEIIIFLQVNTYYYGAISYSLIYAMSKKNL